MAKNTQISKVVSYTLLAMTAFLIGYGIMRWRDAAAQRNDDAIQALPAPLLP